MAKAIDLGIKPASRTFLPSFNTRNFAISAAPVVLAAAGTVDLLKNQGASTVQWALVTISAACSVQLLQDGQPVGVALPVNAGAVVRFAGRLLPNNAKLSVSVSAAASVGFEVAWVKEFKEDLMELATQVSYGPASGTISGTITNQVYKKTTIETTTPLAANGVFQGGWHDSNLDGILYVVASSFSNVAGANNALMIQESDDITNASFTRNASGTTGAVTAGALNRTAAFIKARYWRVVYTNGAVLQTTFEVTSSGTDNTPLPNLIASSSPDAGIPCVVGLVGGGTTSIPTLDNNLIVNRASDNVGNAAPLETAICFYGGRFTGTADGARQGSSLARTSTIFRQVSTVALGSVAIWTPAAGNKFRLLAFRVQVTGLAKAAAAADLKIALLDNAADIGLSTFATIQTAALTTDAQDYDSGWIDLGSFGILSAAANNALNVNLSFALTGGLVNVNVCGTEE